MEIEDDLISLKLPDATQEESIIKVIGVGAVSYTHLDVYKRQPPMSILPGMPWIV